MAAASLNTLASYLTTGYWLDRGSSPHSFATNTVTVNISTLAPSDRTLAREAFGLWSDASGLEFTFTNNDADINVVYGDGASNLSYYDNGVITQSIITISTTWGGGIGAGINSYRFQTFVHEIGHSVGLGHLGNYNVYATYPFDATFDNDSWNLSVMSYFSQTENTTVDASYAFVLTPQLADILAIQSLYGPGQTRTGDTIYGDGNTSGRAVYGTGFTSFPSVTITDSGGNDTLNYSGYSGAQTINLEATRFSSVYGERNNVTIARGVTIENAVGGSGRDELNGNGAANRLSGGPGDDVLRGAGGDDTLDGGRGADRLVGGAGQDLFVGGPGRDSHDGSSGRDSVDFQASAEPIQVDLKAGSGTKGDAAGDTFTSVEGVRGTDRNDRINGDSSPNAFFGYGGNDRIGGSSGNDSINAGGGDDGVWGGTGDDSLVGGNDNDSLFGAEGNDTLRGNAHDDTLDGGEGNDLLDGGVGHDTITGGSGDDTILGATGRDFNGGGAGIDTVDYSASSAIAIDLSGSTRGVGGHAQDDRLVNVENVIGTHFADRIEGSDNADMVNAGSGRDTLLGRGGDDVLLARNGKDEVRGGSGKDLLVGGHGDDRLFGGPGGDTFRFNVKDTGRDVIVDYAKGDTIEVTSGVGVASAPGLFDTEEGAIVDYGAGSVLVEDVRADDLAIVLT